MPGILSTRASRRGFVAASAGLALGATRWPASAAAQAAPEPEASPPAALADFPRTTITIDDTAVTVPDGVTAGLTLVTVVNAMSPENGPEHMIWGKLPADVSRDDVLALLATEGTPAAAPAATPTETAGDKLLDRMTIIGGPDLANPGGTASGVVAFEQGTYMLLNVFGSQLGFLEVGPATADAVTAPPAAEVAVTLVEMTFEGLDAGVPAGRHLWQVTNAGAMPHELNILPVAPGATEEQFLAAMSDPNAPFAPAAGNSILSPGQTAWPVVDLAPGTYAAACFVPFLWEGAPHAFMGMVKLFTAR
jgi:hypothetical protein